MKEWVNGSCKISILGSDGKLLFFSVKQVMSVTDTHITFIDKFNNIYTFHKRHIEEIQPYNPEKE